MRQTTEHSALLALPLEQVMPVLRQGAAALSLPVEDFPMGARLDLPGGEMYLSGDDDHCHLWLSAESPARLTELRDTIGHYFDHAGLPARLEWAANQKSGRPANLTVARITANDRISPSFRRMRFEADFTEFDIEAMHFRLLYPPEGDALPWCDDTGATIWPHGIDAWHRPPYTIRRMDPERRWMDVDIFLHDGGRVTEWAARTVNGDLVALSGPGGKSPQIAPWIGYIGDETAMPVILRMLERLPDAAQGVARIFVADAADAQDIALPAGVDLQWVTPDSGLTPLDALQALTPPDSGRYVFFAAERQDAAAAREIMVKIGLKRGEFHAAAYWSEGWTPPDAQPKDLPRRLA